MNDLYFKHKYLKYKFKYDTLAKTIQDGGGGVVSEIFNNSLICRHFPYFNDESTRSPFTAMFQQYGLTISDSKYLQTDKKPAGTGYILSYSLQKYSNATHDKQQFVVMYLIPTIRDDNDFQVKLDKYSTSLKDKPNNNYRGDLRIKCIRANSLKFVPTINDKPIPTCLYIQRKQRESPILKSENHQFNMEFFLQFLKIMKYDKNRDMGTNDYIVGMNPRLTNDNGEIWKSGKNDIYKLDEDINEQIPDIQDNPYISGLDAPHPNYTYEHSKLLFQNNNVSATYTELEKLEKLDIPIKQLEEKSNNILTKKMFKEYEPWGYWNSKAIPID